MSLFNSDLPPGLESAITAMEKQFILMRSSGSSIRDIAKTLKKSPTTICSWNKKFAKEIISARNAEFCELQKKVIETKTSRLNFIKSEIDRLSHILHKQKMVQDGPLWDYRDSLNLFVRLSELMSNFESEMLTVGVKFKDNIEPEIYESENDTINNDDFLNAVNNPDVTKTVTGVTPNNDVEITDNTELKKIEKHIGTNCNTVTPKKYETYKKHKLK